LGFKLSEIDVGQRITLYISSNNRNMTLGAFIKKQLANNIVSITLDYSGDKRLIFDNVQIDVEFTQDNAVPFIWHNAKITTYKTEYVLQVFTDGTRHNRRNSFRVAVATRAQFYMAGRGSQFVMIKDISLSGFSIADRNKELGLSKGDRVSVYFEDIGHKLDLEGIVVRIEEREDMTVYGLEICNLCKDLSSYVSVKQRRNKGK